MDSKGHPRRIAIVPARGGSKRIPRKNIREFCGRPMIAHILDAAQTSGLFSAIHVSTEDVEIAEVVARLGHGVQFMRPAHLADDHTGIMPVLHHVLATFKDRGQTFDQVVSLMACAPLITANDLIEAARLFDSLGGTTPLLTIAPYPAPVEWAFHRESTGHLIPVQPGAFAIRSQDLRPAYYDAGAFAFFPSAAVLGNSVGSDQGFVGYPLARTKAVDIDNLEDWALAETIFRGQNA
ncbi:MAG: acylneuraminate cytidylyltransferase family protein [Magnetococcales bacterium]|nr:acylneuraminate cytidylyltransferase family protein [Magnetococcales bacterium]